MLPIIPPNTSSGNRKMSYEWRSIQGSRTVCDYVHLNPLRAKLPKPEQHLKEYRWSSFPEYLRRPSKRWPWLRVDRLLGEWGIAQDNAAGRREYECL